MRRPFALVVAVLAVLLGAATLGFAKDATPGVMSSQACAAGTPEASPMAMETAEAMASPAAGAVVMASPEATSTTGCSVEIRDFAFQPGTIEVQAGTTVTWTNQDTAPHTVTSDDGAFDSGILKQGDSVSFTFEQPGTYHYHCNVHPRMKGTVVVV